MCSVGGEKRGKWQWRRKPTSWLALTGQVVPSTGGGHLHHVVGGSQSASATAAVHHHLRG